jgi:inner membrane protein
LASAGAGVASGTIFAATYALLYLLVTTDNYALLAGSIALFTILTVVMLMTRRLDWYAQQDLVTASIDSASQSEA